MSDVGINWLRESNRFHGDGTFKESAKRFYQFYVLMGEKNGRMLPCFIFKQIPRNIFGVY